MYDNERSRRVFRIRDQPNNRNSDEWLGGWRRHVVAIGGTIRKRKVPRLVKQKAKIQNETSRTIHIHIYIYIMYTRVCYA